MFQECHAFHLETMYYVSFCTMCSVNYVSMCFNVMNDFMFVIFYFICHAFHLERNNGFIFFFSMSCIICLWFFSMSCMTLLCFFSFICHVFHGGGKSAFF
jgi:hypothetical protein